MGWRVACNKTGVRILSSATNSTSTVPLLSKGGEADTGFQTLLANVSADKSSRAVALVQKDTNADAASPGVNPNLRETSQPSTSASSSDQRKSAPVASASIGNTSEPVQKTVARLQEVGSRAVDE